MIIFFSCTLTLVLIFLSPLPFYFSSLFFTLPSLLLPILSLLIMNSLFVYLPLIFLSPLSFYFSSSFFSPSHSFSLNNSLFFYLSLIFLSPLTFYFSSLFVFPSLLLPTLFLLIIIFVYLSLIFLISLLFSSSHFFTLLSFSLFHTLFPSLIIFFLFSRWTALVLKLQRMMKLYKLWRMQVKGSRWQWSTLSRPPISLTGVSHAKSGLKIE